MCGIGVLFNEGDGDGWDAMELRRRGPDASGSAVAGGLYFAASVLHIRGDTAVTQQPHIDGAGNVLLWNGEVFGHSGKPVEGSDTALVGHILRTAVDRGNDGNDGDPAARCGQLLAAALADIVGPYAFIFYCQRLSTVFYGRDPFGRRSLLVAGGADAVHAVASVRPQRSIWEWAEVPVTGIFAVSTTTVMMTTTVSPPLLIPWPPTRLQLARQQQKPQLAALTALLPTPIVINSASQAPLLLALADENPADRVPWQRLLVALANAVYLRVRAMRHVPLPPPSSSVEPRPARFGVLFSGGIDSVVLTALLHLCLDDASEPVDLINVSFSDDCPTPPTGGCEQPAPDRLAAVAALLELRRQYPGRPFRLVHVDVPATARCELEAHVAPLVHPCKTVMDLNIGKSRVRAWVLNERHAQRVC